ncbi:MAG: hypothetical protein JXR44_01690 [Thiotrichales bacterium]|nr:hypothetical protein [Thiotrichales bacterium]
MAKFTLGGKEFDTNDLTDDAKAHYQAIQVCEAKILDLNAQVAIMQTARNAYGEKLLELMIAVNDKKETLANTVDEEKIPL